MSNSESLVRDEVAEAREAILEVVRAHPDHAWRAFDLTGAARNGGDHGALGIALLELIDDGLLVQNPGDQLIRLA